MAVSLGAFTGGLLSRKIKMTPLNTMLMLIIFYGVNVISMITGFFLGCDQPKLVGSGGNGFVLRIIVSSLRVMIKVTK